MKWRCLLCNFEFNEFQSYPEHGISSPTRWQNLADNWKCPCCGAPKSNFIKLKTDKHEPSSH